MAERQAFARYLAPWHDTDWVVYAKPPAAGPEPVLAYLSRYTHRVAISNSRLVRFDAAGVTFKWKDYRAKGRYRQKTMTLTTDQFIRRFMSHVLLKGFHRIRHYGLLANGNRAANLARARHLLAMPAPVADDDQTVDQASEPSGNTYPCPACGGPMVIIETFEPGATPRHPRQRAPPQCPSDIP